VRNINTGELAGARDVNGVTRFICIDEKNIIFNTKNTGYLLPDLSPTTRYTCRGNEAVKAIKRSGKLTACLTESGNIGTLKNQ
jgi:hypothetical protein